MTARYGAPAEAEADKTRRKRIIDEAKQQEVRARINLFESGEWRPMGTCCNCNGVKRTLHVPGPFVEEILNSCARKIGGMQEEILHVRPAVKMKGIPEEIDTNLYILKTSEGGYVLLAFEKLFDGHANGPFVGVVFDGAFVALQHSIGDKYIEWGAVPFPSSKKSKNKSEAKFIEDSPFARVCRWIDTARQCVKLVTHGLYVSGTLELLGHAVMESEFAGVVIHRVDPPTSHKPIKSARARALARSELQNARIVIDSNQNSDIFHLQ